MFMSTKTFKLLSPLMKTSQKKKELEDVKTWIILYRVQRKENKW
jgi:hypothetical protein